MIGNREIVISHHEMGIYLGGCMGLGFFSKMDAVGQVAACTFETEEQARAHVTGWDSANDHAAYDYHAVAIATLGCATVEELIAAGLRERIGDEMLSAHLETASCIAA